MQSRRIPILVSATVFAFATVVPALAQSPSAADIIKALRPQKANQNTGSRSINDLIGERGITTEGGDEKPPSIDVKVNFAFDSIKLENETLLTLRALGTALNSDELADQTILVIGHTDGRGTDEYNDDLSSRRAISVVRYLVDKHRVNAVRIRSEGHGERELLHPDDPENEINRRVEIRNITGQSS